MKNKNLLAGIEAGDVKYLCRDLGRDARTVVLDCRLVRDGLYETPLLSDMPYSQRGSKESRVVLATLSTCRIFAKRNLQAVLPMWPDVEHLFGSVRNSVPSAKLIIRCHSLIMNSELEARHDWQICMHTLSRTMSLRWSGCVICRSIHH